jgi:hypothetical protein
MKTLCAFLSALVLSIWLLGCFGSGPTAAGDDPGSGSEIVGKVEYGDTSADSGMSKAAAGGGAAGIPVIGALIYLYPENFAVDPDKPLEEYVPEATTDPDGQFGIADVPVGTWVLEATDGKGKTVSRRVPVPGDGRRIDVGTLVLADPASLRLTLDAAAVPSDLVFTVYVLGTRAYASGGENGLSVDLAGIPTGVKYAICCGSNSR